MIISYISYNLNNDDYFGIFLSSHQKDVYESGTLLPLKWHSRQPKEVIKKEPTTLRLRGFFDAISHLPASTQPTAVVARLHQRCCCEATLMQSPASLLPHNLPLSLRGSFDAIPRLLASTQLTAVISSEP